MLRERLNALELANLEAALAWADGSPLPGRIAAYAPAPSADAPAGGSDSLLAKVKPARPGLARLLADWLAGVRCRADVASALRDRGALRLGEAFVTPQGHVISAQGIGLFAPDSELHGVLARQRELADLEPAIATARQETSAAAAARDQIEAELNVQQEAYHGESLALSSQQRRCHELELELLQLQQTAEAAAKRRAGIADELAALAAEEGVERQGEVAIEQLIAQTRDQLAAAGRERAAAELARDRVEATQAQARERLHAAERSTQEAGFSERSCRERIAEFARRRAGLEAQVVQQQELVGQLSAERAQIDWAPVEAALQAAARGAHRGRAGARGRARPPGSRRCGTPRWGRGAARRRTAARAGAREDRGHAPEAAGGRCSPSSSSRSSSPPRTPSSKRCRPRSRHGVAPARCPARSNG